jgi:hypothetical protein
MQDGAEASVPAARKSILKIAMEPGLHLHFPRRARVHQLSCEYAIIGIDTVSTGYHNFFTL